MLKNFISDFRWGGTWISPKKRISGKDSFHDSGGAHHQGNIAVRDIGLFVRSTE
jgi:hypothetical protein